MGSTQARVQAELERQAKAKGLTLTTDYAFSNRGTWRFFPQGGWEPVMTIGFDWDGSHLEVYPRCQEGSSTKIEPYPFEYDEAHPNVFPRRVQPSWAKGKVGPAYVAAFIEEMSALTDEWYDNHA